MTTRHYDELADRSVAWLLMAGFGLLGAVTARLVGDDSSRQRHAGPPEYAPLVPIEQARREHQWTKDAKKSK